MKQNLCPAKDDRVHYMVLSKRGVEYSGRCPHRFHDVSTQVVKIEKPKKN